MLPRAHCTLDLWCALPSESGSESGEGPGAGDTRIPGTPRVIPAELGTDAPDQTCAAAPCVTPSLPDRGTSCPVNNNSRMTHTIFWSSSFARTQDAKCCHGERACATILAEQQARRLRTPLLMNSRLGIGQRVEIKQNSCIKLMLQDSPVPAMWQLVLLTEKCMKALISKTIFFLNCYAKPFFCV